MTKKYVWIIILISIISINSNGQSGVTVAFPKVSEPVQITNNDKEHLFASYYGINSWSGDQKYVTVLETDIKYKLPEETDPATLGLVDMKTKEFIPLTQTRAWNFQEGCMAHWLGTNPDSLIIYNDFRDSRYVSVIMNVYTKKRAESHSLSCKFSISKRKRSGKHQFFAFADNTFRLWLRRQRSRSESRCAIS